MSSSPKRAAISFSRTTAPSRQLAPSAVPHEPQVQRSQRKVPIEHVRANPRNPRKLFSEAELSELAALDWVAAMVFARVRVQTPLVAERGLEA